MDHLQLLPPRLQQHSPIDDATKSHETMSSAMVVESIDSEESVPVSA